MIQVTPFFIAYTGGFMTKINRCFIRGCLALGLVASLVSDGHGNTERPVHYQSGDPYLLVDRDDVGASSREPGIYAWSQQGAWELILGGSVGKMPSNMGVLFQPKSAEESGRIESLHAVNGRLHLFHSGSRADRPKSILTLGDGRGRVLHPVSGEPVSLPLIPELVENVTVVSEVLEDAEYFVVSIKNTAGHAHGQVGREAAAATFGFTLKRYLVNESPVSERGDILLHGAPVLLSFEFLNAQQAKALLYAGVRSQTASLEPGFISPLFLHQLLNRREAAAHDEPLTRVWARRVQRELIRVLKEPPASEDDGDDDIPSFLVAPTSEFHSVPYFIAKRPGHSREEESARPRVERREYRSLVDMIEVPVFPLPVSQGIPALKYFVDPISGAAGLVGEVVPSHRDLQDHRVVPLISGILPMVNQGRGEGSTITFAPRVILDVPFPTASGRLSSDGPVVRFLTFKDGRVYALKKVEQAASRAFSGFGTPPPPSEAVVPVAWTSPFSRGGRIKGIASVFVPGTGVEPGASASSPLAGFLVSWELTDPAGGSKKQTLFTAVHPSDPATPLYSFPVAQDAYTDEELQARYCQLGGGVYFDTLESQYRLAPQGKASGEGTASGNESRASGQSEEQRQRLVAERDFAPHLDLVEMAKVGRRVRDESNTVHSSASRVPEVWSYVRARRILQLGPRVFFLQFGLEGVVENRSVAQHTGLFTSASPGTLDPSKLDLSKLIPLGRGTLVLPRGSATEAPTSTAETEGHSPLDDPARAKLWMDVARSRDDSTVQLQLAFLRPGGGNHTEGQLLLSGGYFSGAVLSASLRGMVNPEHFASSQLVDLPSISVKNRDGQPTGAKRPRFLIIGQSVTGEVRFLYIETVREVMSTPGATNQERWSLSVKWNPYSQPKDEEPLGLSQIAARLRVDQNLQPFFVSKTLRGGELDEKREPFDADVEMLDLVAGRRFNPVTSGTRYTFHRLDEKAATKLQEHQSVQALWRVPQNSDRYKDLVVKAAQESRFSTDVYGQVRDLMSQIADPLQPSRKIILLVNNSDRAQTLKNYLEGYVLALRGRQNAEPSGAWHERSAKSVLYIPDPAVVEQGRVVHAISQVRDGVTGKRSVLYFTSEHLKALMVPQVLQDESGHYAGLKLLDSTGVGMTPAQDGPFQEMESKTRAVDPSFFYLLATEGRLIDAPRAREYFEHPDPQRFSSITILTESELDAMRKTLALETELGVWGQYEVVKVAPPTLDERARRILEVLSLQSVVQLGYSIRISQEGGAQGIFQPGVLADYLARRLDREAREKDMDPNEVTEKFREQFANVLLTDAEARKRRIIDSPLIASVMMKVLPVSLRVEELSPQDPLRILYRHGPDGEPGEEAARNMVNRGYVRHPREIRGIIDAILAQTKVGTDTSGRKLISAMVLAGPPGTGKTSFAEELMREQGLRPFDFSPGADNRDAGYMLINMPSILPNHGGGTSEEGRKHQAQTGPASGRTASQVWEMIETALAGPRGSRMTLIFDDFHNAQGDVKDFFNGKLRALTDSHHLSVTDRSPEARSGTTSKTVTVAVRNIVVIITLNLTTTTEMLEKVGAKNKYNPTVEEKALAVMSTKDRPLDQSFLTRLRGVYEFDTNPPEAKFASLSREMRGVYARSGSDGRVAIIDSRVYRDLAHRLHTVNARNFNEGGRAALASALLQNPDAPPVSIAVPFVSPYEDLGHGAWGTGPSAQGSMDRPISNLFRTPLENFQVSPSRVRTTGGGPLSSGAESDAAIAGQASKAIAVLPLEGGQRHRGIYELSNYLMNNFRLFVYYALLTELYQRGSAPQGQGADGMRSGDKDLRETRVKPLAMALMTHLRLHPRLALSPIHVDTMDWDEKLLRDSRARLSEEVERWRFESLWDYTGSSTPPTMIQTLVSLDPPSDEPKWKEQPRYGRLVLVREWTDKLARKLVPVVLSAYRTNEAGLGRGGASWVEALSKSEPKPSDQSWLRQVGALLYDDLDRYIDQDRSLPGGAPSTGNRFERIRFFLLALDHAILRLKPAEAGLVGQRVRWTTLGRFLVDALARARQDLALKESNGYMEFFYKNPLSPISPRDIQVLFNDIEFHKAYNAEDADRVASHYWNSCQHLLLGSGG